MMIFCLVGMRWFFDWMNLKLNLGRVLKDLLVVLRNLRLFFMMLKLDELFLGLKCNWFWNELVGVVFFVGWVNLR